MLCPKNARGRGHPRARYIDQVLYSLDELSRLLGGFRRCRGTVRHHGSPSAAHGRVARRPAQEMAYGEHERAVRNGR
jgi:hypothetical protein